MWVPELQRSGLLCLAAAGLEQLGDMLPRASQLLRDDRNLGSLKFPKFKVNLSHQQPHPCPVY